MKILPLIVCALLLNFQSVAAETSEKSDDQKTLYTIGMILGKQLDVFNLTPAEFEYVKQGLLDAASGKKPDFDIAAYNEKVQLLARARRKALGEKMAGANKEYLENAAREKGALRTQSGLVFISLKDGDGASPGAGDTVKVNYRGTLIDGKEFDSSYRRGKPVEFKLSKVIKCWQEGVQKMKVGGKAKLVCPSALAYGENGSGDMILPGATLSFELELLGTRK